MEMPRNIFQIRVTSTLLVLLLMSAIDMNVASTKKGPISTIRKCPIPPQLEAKLHADPLSIETASTDFGNVVHFRPSAVLHPSTVHDIQMLVASSYNCSHPFVVSTRGHGHSVEGQAMAPKGVVVDMQEYKKNRHGLGVVVSEDLSYADVGGDLFWSDVLNGTLEKGVLPVSWTGYLNLTVGGTLSNAGLGGQTFRVGPQISNVYEMDVVTGKGELVTCSASKNSELFYGVLGGLGQCGVITRARIRVEPAKPRVRWLRALYSDFEQYTKDQDSINGRKQSDAVGHMETYFLLDNDTPNDWATSFFPPEDLPQILSLQKKYGVIYCLEIADPYDNGTEHAINKRLKKLIKGLSPIPGLVHQVDVPYADFLKRTKFQLQKILSFPFLCLFIPKSQFYDFNLGVIRGILLQRRMTVSPTMLYVVNKSKLDQRMSLATPEEDIFYGVLLLQGCEVANLKLYQAQNNDIIKFCIDNGIKFKTYLHSYSKKHEWVRHFGSKWATFKKRKQEFDPKHILSPGQRIFN